MHYQSTFTDRDALFYKVPFKESLKVPRNKQKKQKQKQIKETQSTLLLLIPKSLWSRWEMEIQLIGKPL